MKKQISSTVIASRQRVILFLSLPLIALIIVCSVVGLIDPGIYAGATPTWLTQTVAQDAVDLFLVTPILIVGALYAYRGVKLAFLMWGGTVAYLAYTFTIYCFTVRFNLLFPAYCVVLGLSVYSFVWFVYTQAVAPIVSELKSKRFAKAMGIYFIAIAVIFYILWLLEVVPASLSNTMPKSLIETGLLTNPVQVIDLALFLPFVFIVGVMLLKEKRLAFILAPAILTFFVLMDVTIAALAVALYRSALGGSMMLAALMSALALFSIGCLIWYTRIAADVTN